MVRTYRELFAWQLADAFNDEVHRLVLGSLDAKRDFRYRDQVLEASSSVPSNISEGFLRFSPIEFARFLDYAISSLGEAEGRLRDGIRRRYFSESDCRSAFVFAKRAMKASIGLKRSQIEYAASLGLERRRGNHRSRRENARTQAGS